MCCLCYLSTGDQFVKETDPAKAFRFLLGLDESCLSRHPEIKDMCKLIKRMGFEIFSGRSADVILLLAGADAHMPFCFVLM